MSNLIREAMSNLSGRWYKGGMSDKAHANFCGIGWVVETRRILGFQAEHDVNIATRFMHEVAMEQYPDRAYWNDDLAPFPSFNDHPDTTEEDVLRVMEKAAVKLDEQV